MIDVIGTDAGAPASLSPVHQTLLREAQLIAAPLRLHQALKDWNGGFPAALIASDHPVQLLAHLRSVDGQQRVVVLASGDPLWFGIGRVLQQGLGSQQLRFHPSASSMQLAFARIGRPWQDASWLSLHGRDPAALLPALQKRPAALAVLTDPNQGGAESVRLGLLASGLAACYRFWVCECLGDPLQEQVRCLDPQAGPLPPLNPLHLVVLEAVADRLPLALHLPLFGLEDGLFLQHQDRPGLMTKREVRIQLLADLCLPQAGVLWDLGAGVGSVGLEALRLSPGLALHAVERRGGSAALIRANAQRLGVTPAAVHECEALALVQGGVKGGIPDPDRVLLGGGGRQRQALLAAVLRRLKPDGRVVIPLATLEGLAELRPLIEQAGLDVRVSQHQACRGVPLADGTRLTPMNPVLVLVGQRRCSALP